MEKKLLLPPSLSLTLSPHYTWKLKEFQGYYSIHIYELLICQFGNYFYKFCILSVEHVHDTPPVSIKVDWNVSFSFQILWGFLRFCLHIGNRNQYHCLHRWPLWGLWSAMLHFTMRNLLRKNIWLWSAKLAVRKSWR